MTDGTTVLTSPTLLRELGDPDHREAAWRTFLERYQPLIYRWSRRSGLNDVDAKDISATVLAKLVIALRDFVYDPAHRFRGWLKTLVENEVRDLYRQRARRPGDPEMPTALVDVDGHAFRAYGVSAGTVVDVRPDGYLGGVRVTAAS